MFLGHFGAAFAAKRVAPKTSLGVYIAAAQLPDLIWPIFLLLGVEHVEIDPGNTVVTPLAFIHYPWTHSLLFTALWGLLLGGIVFAWRRDARGAIIAGLLVLSHWVLDAIMHRPDLPLVPGDPARVGLGLWNSLAATLLVEGLLFAAGVWIYTRSTAALNRPGRWAWWALIGFLLLVYTANLAGPPPPSVDAVAVTVLLLWLLVPWAWWIDRNRARAVHLGP